MSKILFFLTCICSLFQMKNEQPADWVWKHRNPDINTVSRFETTQPPKKNTYQIPVLWEDIDRKTIDSLMPYMESFDAAFTKAVDEKNDTLPEYLTFELHKRIIAYNGKKGIKIDDCVYNVYSFTTSVGATFEMHDYYEFFLVPEIGIIALVNQSQEAPEEAERYILADIRSRDGKSLIHKKHLEEIIKNLIPIEN